jgi:hypothetical protein
MAIDLYGEMAERLRVSFHAQQRHHSPALFAAAPAPAASPAACELELAPQDE